jgi:hypothetical protein
MVQILEYRRPREGTDMQRILIYDWNGMKFRIHRMLLLCQSRIERLVPLQFPELTIMAKMHSCRLAGFYYY